MEHRYSLQDPYLLSLHNKLLNLFDPWLRQEDGREVEDWFDPTTDSLCFILRHKDKTVERAIPRDMESAVKTAIAEIEI